MAAHKDSDRFIPFRKKDIRQMLLDDGGLKTETQIEDFRQFCHILQSIFHFEFHAKLEKLKDSYFPMNPDLKHWKKFGNKELDDLSRELFDSLLEVLNHANYDEITPREIEQAYASSALLQVNVRIDMDAFERIQIFYRGRRTEHFQIKKLWGLQKKKAATEVLERVVLLVRFKPKAYFEHRKHKPKTLNFEPGSTLIKLFKDVPKEDIEILFPNCRVTMGVKDKLLLTVPAIAGGYPVAGHQSHAGGDRPVRNDRHLFRRAGNGETKSAQTADRRVQRPGSPGRLLSQTVDEIQKQALCLSKGAQRQSLLSESGQQRRCFSQLDRCGRERRNAKRRF